MKTLRASNDLLTKIYGIIEEIKGNLKEIFKGTMKSSKKSKESLRKYTTSLHIL